MKRKGQRRRLQRERALLKRGGFTLLDSLMASGDKPTRPDRKASMLLSMHSALDALTHDAQPHVEHWRSLADAVNLCGALIAMGWAEDADGVVNVAVAEMAESARRYGDTGNIRLSGAGLSAVRSALETWEQAMNTLAERQILHAKRYAVREIYEAIYEGKNNDVQVVEVERQLTRI